MMKWITDREDLCLQFGIANVVLTSPLALNDEGTEVCASLNERREDKYELFEKYGDSPCLQRTVTKLDENAVLVKTEVQSDKRLSLRALISGKFKVSFLSDAPLRMLCAPFDNDKWAEFVDRPLLYAKPSYEFTVLHPDGRPECIVIGSVDHENWKSALILEDDGVVLRAGWADEQTRDLNGIQHGCVKGKQISSTFFIGAFASEQEGLAAFGKACAKRQGQLPWEGPVIFGWNSWSAMMGSVSSASYKAASDMMKSISHTYCGSDGNQFINYDAMWEPFSNEMPDSVDHVRKNGQHPGAYFCPFITGGNLHREVSGTRGRYFYDDIVLRDHDGNILPAVDGLIALDPTHPGTLQHMEYEIGRIAAFGFESIKTDFVGHGCREGAFYNKEITTGVQAFRFGMQHFVDTCQAQDHPIFISLSIAPIFPNGYGHARRISCDAFGTIDQTKYLNNSITHLWWMNNCLYRFNDPDHIVVYRTFDKPSISYEEGFSRYLSGVICGSLMIASDDAQIPEARERVKSIFSNEEINAIARKGESFIPVGMVQSNDSADVFLRKDDQDTYVAVFNYSLSEEKSRSIKTADLGLDSEKQYRLHNCRTKEDILIQDGIFTVSLIPAQAVMLKITATN